MYRTKSLFILILFAALFLHVRADDGITHHLKKMRMDINDDHYVVFEDSSLVVCDRNSDAYLIEVGPDGALFIHAKPESLTARQKEVTQAYYTLMHEIYETRNMLGHKGIKIGMDGVKLALRAVGKTVDLILSGFDEEVSRDMEDELEEEAQKLKKQADKLEDEGDHFEEMIPDINNFIKRELYPAVESLKEFDLILDKDTLPQINIRTDDD